MDSNNFNQSKPTHSWTEWAMTIVSNAQAGVQQEITEHKAKGNPIYYEDKNKLIMENSKGERFEYKPTDKGIEILNKVQTIH